MSTLTTPHEMAETGVQRNGSTPDRAYTGQTSDHAETGFYHYNARYYDPEIHRFISADTIIPNPANPQTLNRYSYVGNNPATYTDPTGHVADFCGHGASVGGCGEFLVAPYDDSVVAYTDAFELTFSIDGGPSKTFRQSSPDDRNLIARAFIWDPIKATESCLQCLEEELAYLYNLPLVTDIGGSSPIPACAQPCEPSTWSRVESVLSTVNPLYGIPLNRVTGGLALAAVGSAHITFVYGSTAAWGGGAIGLGGAALVSFGVGLIAVGGVIAIAGIVDAWNNP